MQHSIPRSARKARQIFGFTVEPIDQAARLGIEVEMSLAGVDELPHIGDGVLVLNEVRVSADLRLATIYIMPLGGHDEKEVLDALERNSRYVRGEIARRVNLKFAPEIRFRIDERFDEAERIEKLLRTPAVQRDLKRRDEE